MCACRSSVSSAGSFTRPSSMPRKITLSVVGTWSSAGVVWVSVTGAAGRGAAIGRAAACPSRGRSGSSWSWWCWSVLVVVVVDERGGGGRRGGGRRADHALGEDLGLRAIADALGIAAAITTATAISSAHTSARPRGCRFIGGRSWKAAAKCTNRTRSRGHSACVTLPGWPMRCRRCANGVSRPRRAGCDRDRLAPPGRRRPGVRAADGRAPRGHGRDPLRRRPRHLSGPDDPLGHPGRLPAR